VVSRIERERSVARARDATTTAAAATAAAATAAAATAAARATRRRGVDVQPECELAMDPALVDCLLPPTSAAFLRGVASADYVAYNTA
jgi:hypothetical protein